MERSAEDRLWDMAQSLGRGEKSSPLALTDVFVSEVRRFVDDESRERETDETISLSLEAGVPLSRLRRCIENMTGVGRITFEQGQKVLQRIPPEEEKAE